MVLQRRIGSAPGADVVIDLVDELHEQIVRSFDLRVSEAEDRHDRVPERFADLRATPEPSCIMSSCMPAGCWSASSPPVIAMVPSVIEFKTSFIYLAARMWGVISTFPA